MLKKCFLLMVLLVLSACEEQTSKSSKVLDTKVTIGVSISNTQNPFFASAFQGFKQFAQENNQVDIIANDAQNDWQKQLRFIDEALAQGAQALIINMVNASQYEEVYKRLKNKNIPVVFYNRSPGQKGLLSYQNSVFVDGDAVQGGILQGLAVLEGWSKHQWDKNADGKIQYAVLMGFKNNPSAIARTTWSTGTLNSYPSLAKPTEEVALEVANFNAELATEITEKWIRSGLTDQIEVVLANNDVMALAAMKKFEQANLAIPVFGIDAIPEAIKMVEEKRLAGTVINDAKRQAETAMMAAINLIQGNPANQNTAMKLDYQVILVPYKIL